MNYFYKTLFTGLLFSPLVLFATEEYELTITMPVSRFGGQVEYNQVTFVTYYSRTETQVSAVTWDPCKSKNAPSDCNLINPLHQAKLKVFISAYNANDMKHLEGCYVEIDFTNYKPLSNRVRNSLKTQNEKSELLQLAVKSLQKNTRDSLQYVDCELRIKGIKNQVELINLNMPEFLNPVIPACKQHTDSGREFAKDMNDKGLEHYRARNWSQSEVSFRRAAEFDCSFFIARTNLASVLALQKKYDQAQAVLWRAVKLDKKLALKKLETDPDYRLLKKYGNFYSAASPIGLLYRNYCYQSINLVDVDPQLPGLIAKSNLKKQSKYFTVATRYSFEEDFNKNGIPDKVYPLVIRHLHSLLVVFDGTNLESKGCTSTPLQRSDLSGIYSDDPCKMKIYAGAEKDKRGIRLETDHIKINRLVCK